MNALLEVHMSKQRKFISVFLKVFISLALIIPATLSFFYWKGGGSDWSGFFSVALGYSWFVPLVAVLAASSAIFDRQKKRC